MDERDRHIRSCRWTITGPGGTRVIHEPGSVRATSEDQRNIASSLNPPTAHATVAQCLRGKAELTDPPPLTEADLFDEAGYLRLYPGIATAIMQGSVDTALNHYLLHGRHEARRPNDVDPDFYLAAYPEIERDLGHPPRPTDAALHLITLGRARGYLPNAKAPRAPNSAAMGSPFGGFWTDHANALDLIQSRFDLGWIKRRDAALLRSFALEGIVEFDRAPDKDQIRDAALMVDQAFTGRYPDLLFQPVTPGAEPERWRPELTPRNVAALDPHMFSQPVRAMLLDRSITDFLSLIFGSRPKLTASKAYLRESAAPDRDAAYQAYTLNLSFAAVTFSLQEADDAQLSVWPGSHRWPDLLWAGEHVSLPEASRANVSGLEHEIARREGLVRDLLRGRDPGRPGLSAGTRMIRHANLIHAADPPEAPKQQRSLTAWYCPAHVEPTHMESARVRTHVQDGIRFSSGVYPALDPLDWPSTCSIE
jgi:hypothetical protein